MATKVGSRGKRSVAMMKDVPKELADRWEFTTQEVAQRMFQTRKKIKEAIGQRPYKGLPVDDNELRKRWSQISHDTDALVKLFQENATYKPDGTVLIPKELMETIREIHRQRVEGGYDQ